MCNLKEVGKFFIQGTSVFREASKGIFERESDEIRTIRDDIFSERRGTFNEDKEKLIGDKENIISDVKQALGKIQLNNG